ncbi:ABC transporter permease [Flavihumibacter petaseus]|uniref:Transport permease protein n=1 Tax=Flavihumibacter petaseus NBRC 106054 TaxID=1220578 RepID=A0A0E9N5Z4_9BACT|nr:ABC transporter permease [Flavihumibacter petaseus]GAO45228.1 putative polysaccharide ABC transporter permease protein [Flavihumibacter petaseus NBRC 106054]
MSTNSENQWDLVIEPNASKLNLNLQEVWRYRDLMLLFVKRDFVAQFKQTVLGPVWHIIQPILTTAMFLLIFGRIARTSTDNIEPSILFYMSGIVLWNFFSGCLTNVSNTFVTNANIFGKVYFPRLVLPLSVIISNLIKFAIQFLLLIAMMVFFHFRGYPIQPSFNWIFIPVIILILACISLGLGIIISSLTTKYRDFIVLLTFAVQLGMYATPIAYPYSYVQNKSFYWIFKINPLTSIVESFRYCLFGKGTFDLASLSYTIIFMVVILLSGIVVFNKVERNFMDTV